MKVMASTLLSMRDPSRRLSTNSFKGGSGEDQITLGAQKKGAIGPLLCGVGWLGSTQAQLRKDALTGEQLGGKPDNEAHHGQAAIPGLSKVDETEAGLRSVRHGRGVSSGDIVTKGGALLTVPRDTFLAIFRH